MGRGPVTDITIPLPLVRPLGLPVTRANVEEVWNAFIKPEQEERGLQSVETRILMAILRSVYEGLPELEMKVGQRVQYQGATGEVVDIDRHRKVLLYFGTSDGKRIERWVERKDIRPC